MLAFNLLSRDKIRQKSNKNDKNMILEHLDKQTADGTAQNLGKLY